MGNPTAFYGDAANAMGDVADVLNSAAGRGLLPQIADLKAAAEIAETIYELSSKLSDALFMDSVVDVQRN